MYDAAKITPVEAIKAMVVFFPNTDNRVKYSPTKPEVPGKPIDPKTKIRNKLKILALLY